MSLDDEPLDDETLVERLENRLMSQGVYVERTTHEDDTLHVEYETAAERIPKGQLGTVCSELLDAHDAGWNPRDLHLWVFDLEGEFLGEWELREGWFRALDREYISETDFSTLVLSTVRRDD